VFTLLRSQPVYKEERFAGTISTILNITRQKEDEAKLQASEKRFKALFQNSSDGIALLSKDDIIVEVSPSAENITGLSKEELINRARADLGICEHLETTRETLEEVIANPLIIKKAEHEIVTPQGDRKWLEFTYSNLLDEPGVGAVVLNFRDITGRKKQEIQLRESEARLIEAQALAKIGSWEIDLHDGATKWSPEIFRIFETDPEQLIASRHQFLELVHPHDREKLNEAFDRSLKLKGHNVLQHRIVTASGNEKIVLQHWQVFYNDEMVPMRMSGTCQDRTGQVKAEEDNKFKANLLNTVGQAVVATDLDGLITYWNKAAEDIYGWSAAEATGKNIIDLLPAAQSREQARQIMHDLRIGKVWSNEFEVQRKDGSQFCAFVTDSPIYDQHGQLAGMIGVSSDTSERKKIETELKESEARYKTAQKLGKLGHWELDLHNNSVLWSGELYNIFQLDPATTIPRFETVFRFLHPGDEKALKHHVDLTLAGLKPNDSVFKITLDNGDVRYVLEMSELKKDAAGRPLKIVGTVQDVTDQKLTENALVLSEKKYKLLFEENPVPLFMFKESSLEFIEVNHSALQQYGYLKDEFLKMNLNNIIPEKQRVELNELIENHTSESKFEDTVQHKKKNGEVIYTKISTHRILYNQQPVWLSAARDITPEITYEQKLKESQEQLSLIYNNTIDAMWLLSVEDNGVYRFLNINNAYTHLTGAQKQDVVGRQLEEVVPKEHLARLKEKYNDTVNTKNVATFFTTTGLSNSEITAEIRVIPIINEKGVVEQLLGIGNDVTERQKSRKSLVKMNLQLRELTFHLQNVREEERTSIAREIHDELGQQLTVLKMNVAWVKRKMGEQDELIVNKLKETLELCDFTITTIRKIASNLRPSIIDDLGLVAAIEWQCEEFSKRSGVPVNFSSDVNNLKFKPDASIALFRILQEALTNVARHANATNITCTLKKQGGNITLTIIDNGRGFDLSGKRKVKTLGILGMTERAAMINGTYKISSVPNKGTTVSVQIPLKGL
ncbi:MAG TPA: PAS domain S-box protein, partial [Segetibacter sp.]